MDGLRKVVLDLNRAEALVELQQDNTLRAELQICADWLRDNRNDIAFDLVARGETTKQALEELYKQWLKGNTPTQSETTKPIKVQSITDRKSFILPLLTKLGWTVNESAIESELDFHTLTSYLDHKRNPYPGTRKKMAKSLKISLKSLPK
jgi:hypothetical protein